MIKLTIELKLEAGARPGDMSVRLTVNEEGRAETPVEGLARDVLVQHLRAGMAAIQSELADFVKKFGGEQLTKIHDADPATAQVLKPNAN